MILGTAAVITLAKRLRKCSLLCLFTLSGVFIRLRLHQGAPRKACVRITPPLARLSQSEAMSLCPWLGSRAFLAVFKEQHVRWLSIIGCEPSGVEENIRKLHLLLEISDLEADSGFIALRKRTEFVLQFLANLFFENSISVQTVPCSVILTV